MQSCFLNEEETFFSCVRKWLLDPYTKSREPKKPWKFFLHLLCCLFFFSWWNFLMVRKVESWLPLELSKRKGERLFYSSQFMYDFWLFCCCPKLFHLFRWTIKKLGIPNVTLWDPIEVKQKCFLKGSYLGHCLGDPNSRVQEGCHNQLQTILNRTNIPTRGHDWFCIVHDHCIPWDSLPKCNVYHSNLKNKTLKVEHLMWLSKVWIF